MEQGLEGGVQVACVAHIDHSGANLPFSRPTFPPDLHFVPVEQHPLGRWQFVGFVQAILRDQASSP